MFEAASLDQTGQAELEQLVREMERRIPVFGPLHESGESTNRGECHWPIRAISLLLLCSTREDLP
jgi:hypothetical protein